MQYVFQKTLVARWGVLVARWGIFVLKLKRLRSLVLKPIFGGYLLEYNLVLNLSTKKQPKDGWQQVPSKIGSLA